MIAWYLLLQTAVRDEDFQVHIKAEKLKEEWYGIPSQR